MLDKKNLFPISLILVFVASWFIGNISYLFSDLGRGEINNGFIGVRGNIEIFDISIYFLLLVFFILGILIFVLYIYKKYGMEVLTMPSIIIGFVIFEGIMFLLVGSYSTIAIILMTIVGVISFALIADKRGWGKINIITVSIISLIAIPILYRLSQLNAGTIIRDAGGLGSEKVGESGKDLIEGATGIGGENIGLIVISLLLVIIAIIAVAPKIISLFNSDEEKEEQTTIEQDLSESVDRAIRDLNKGKDIKSSIIRCYQKMCFTLEDYGIIYDRHMTPREFEYNAIHNLNLSENTIDELTSIFEEARYSSHSLTESQRKTALKNLKSLKEEIG